MDSFCDALDTTTAAATNDDEHDNDATTRAYYIRDVLRPDDVCCAEWSTDARQIRNLYFRRRKHGEILLRK
jgi:hypothetical protein